MIATIAVIAAIAEKKKSGNHFPAIAATMIAEIEKILSQQLLSLRSLWSFGFHMIAMIAAIAELFFSAIIAIIMETSLKLRLFTK